MVLFIQHAWKDTEIVAKRSIPTTVENKVQESEVKTPNSEVDQLRREIIHLRWLVKEQDEKNGKQFIIERETKIFGIISNKTQGHLWGNSGRRQLN